MVQNGADVLDFRVDLEHEVGLGKIIEKNFLIWCIIVVFSSKAIGKSRRQLVSIRRFQLEEPLNINKLTLLDQRSQRLEEERHDYQRERLLCFAQICIELIKAPDELLLL